MKNNSASNTNQSPAAPNSLFDAITSDCSGDENETSGQAGRIYQSSDLSLKSGNGPSLSESLVDLTFVSSILMSWLTFVHSIRRCSRSFWTFYVPKLAIIGTIYVITGGALVAKSCHLRVSSRMQRSTNN